MFALLRCGRLVSKSSVKEASDTLSVDFEGRPAGSYSFMTMSISLLAWRRGHSEAEHDAAIAELLDVLHLRRLNEHGTHFRIRRKRFRSVGLAF
jgi:hypothetical protein